MRSITAPGTTGSGHFALLRSFFLLSAAESQHPPILINSILKPLAM
jgi:hypothetical protein